MKGSSQQKDADNGGMILACGRAYLLFIYMHSTCAACRVRKEVHVVPVDASTIHTAQTIFEMLNVLWPH